MKTIRTLAALTLAVSALSLAACVGSDPQPDVAATEALQADPAMLVGTFQFVYSDARREAVESALRAEAKTPEELAALVADAEKEALASQIEFAKDGTFHSRVYDKEILAAPYSARGASGSTLVLTMTGPGGEEKRTTVRFQDADTIVLADPRKGELIFRRVHTRG